MINYSSINKIASTGFSWDQFRQALQLIGRSQPYYDAEFLCAAIAGGTNFSFEEMKLIKEGFGEILSNYRRPDFVIRDYKALVEAYPRR
jgi:hypothetical protein